MATTKHTAYGTIRSVLTTDLNSLGNNTNSAASAEYNNSTDLDLMVDLVLNLGTQATRTGGGTVGIYLLSAIDGSTYDTLNEITAEVWTVFQLPPTTAAIQATKRDLALPPGRSKLFVRNQTGVAFNASGNFVKWVTHSLQVS